MTNEPGSEQPAAERHCPSCGFSIEVLARYCPACGRPLADKAPDVDIAGWVHAGWRLFADNIPMAVGLPLVLIIPVFAFLMLSYFGAIGLAIMFDPKSHTPTIAPIILGSVLGTILVVGALVMPPLQAGVYACFLQGIRTGKLTAERFWEGFRHWWACTWVAGVLGLAMIVCLPFIFVLIGIPAMVGLGGLMWFSLFRIVDKGCGGAEALSFAWGIMRGRFWMMLLFMFLASLLMNAGAMAMYLGIVVTFPIGTAAFAAGYHALSKRQEEQTHT